MIGPGKMRWSERANRRDNAVRSWRESLDQPKASGLGICLVACAVALGAVMVGQGIERAVC